MAITAALAIGGALFSALGSYQSSKAASDRLDQQAGLFGMNSAISRWNADISRAQGLDNARLIRRESEFRIGTLSDKFTSSGLALSGTPLLSIQESAREDELAAQKAEHEGELRATGFINQSNVQNLQANIASSEAAATARSGRTAAFGSLLKIGASLGGKK